MTESILMTKQSLSNLGSICLQHLSRGIFLYWKHLSHALLRNSESCYVPLSSFIFRMSHYFTSQSVYFGGWGGSRYNDVREMFACFYALEQIRHFRKEILLLLCCQKPQDNEIRCHTTHAQLFN